MSPGACWVVVKQRINFAPAGMRTSDCSDCNFINVAARDPVTGRRKLTTNLKEGITKCQNECKINLIIHFKITVFYLHIRLHVSTHQSVIFRPT